MNTIDRLTFLQLNYRDTMSACTANKQYARFCASDNFWKEKSEYMYGINLNELIDARYLAYPKKYKRLEQLLEWTPYNSTAYSGHINSMILNNDPNSPIFRYKLKQLFHFDDAYLDNFLKNGGNLRGLYRYSMTIYTHSLPISLSAMMSEDNAKKVVNNILKMDGNNEYAIRVVQDIAQQNARYGKSWITAHPVDTGFYEDIENDLDWYILAHYYEDGPLGMIFIRLIKEKKYERAVQLVSDYIPDVFHDVNSILRTISSAMDRIPHDIIEKIVYNLYFNANITIAYLDWNSSYSKNKLPQIRSLAGKGVSKKLKRLVDMTLDQMKL